MVRCAARGSHWKATGCPNAFLFFSNDFQDRTRYVIDLLGGHAGEEREAQDALAGPSAWDTVPTR
jgi:hypothetical protein